MKIAVMIAALSIVPVGTALGLQDSENVRDHRGGNTEPDAPRDETRSGVGGVVDTLTDPIGDALEPLGDGLEGAVDALGDLAGGGDSDPQEQRDTTVDHRGGRTAPVERDDEIVPARRGRLTAPTGLALGNATPTSLILYWQDNTEFEHGVHVERSTPVAARGGISHDWQGVFSVEERIESQMRGRGTRSDIDDGLARRTRYCYRLRAYSGRVLSDYSEIVCTTLR